MRGDRLVKTLLKHQVRREDVDYIAGLADDLPVKELVDGIYINLEVRRDPSRFEGYSPLLVPSHDAFQAALRLFEDGHIGVEGVAAVAEQLVVTLQRRPPSLLRSAADMVSRGAVSIDTVAALWTTLQRRGLAPDYFVVDASRGEPASRRRREPGEFLTPEAMRG
jgi:hypothetical protein